MVMMKTTENKNIVFIVPSAFAKAPADRRSFSEGWSWSS